MVPPVQECGWLLRLLLGRNVMFVISQHFQQGDGGVPHMAAADAVLPTSAPAAPVLLVVLRCWCWRRPSASLSQPALLDHVYAPNRPAALPCRAFSLETAIGTQCANRLVFALRAFLFCSLMAVLCTARAPWSPQQLCFLSEYPKTPVWTHPEWYKQFWIIRKTSHQYEDWYFSGWF